MSHKFLTQTSFHQLLIKIDHELAEQTRLAGCHCGGPLYDANYPRSPFGLPEALRVHYQERYSFCCGLCRQRTSSPSVRFFGRRWFPMPLLILISALQMGATESRCTKIRKLFGVVISPSTWKRWRYWWRTSFPMSKFWNHAKGLFSTGHLLKGPFPHELFSLFVGGRQENLVSVLKFLQPLTAGFFRAV